MLSISENLRVKGRVPHMNNYGQNYSFGSITPFSVLGGFFCTLEKFTGAVLSNSENSRVKSESLLMTKYWKKCSFGAKTLQVPGSDFLNWKHLLELCWALLKFEVQRSKVKVTIWPNKGKFTVLEPLTLYRGGSWMPVCGQGNLSQPAGGGIPSMLQHQILFSFIKYTLSKTYFGHTGTLWCHAWGSWEEIGGPSISPLGALKYVYLLQMCIVFPNVWKSGLCTQKCDGGAEEDHSRLWGDARRWCPLASTWQGWQTGK